MAGYKRTAIRQFSLANGAYVNATVTFYTVDPVTYLRTTTLATLYSAPTGVAQAANPYTLNGTGKFTAPVYADVPTIAIISNSEIDSHETGIIQPISGSWRSDWAANEVYFEGDLIRDGAAGSNTKNIYICLQYHQTGVSFAADLAALKWAEEVNVSDIISRIDDAITAATNAATSATNAASSASSASTSASTATTQATNATTQATNAAASATAAANSAAAIVDFRYVATTGAGNAYVANYTPDVSLTDGLLLRLKANHSCTGPSTLAVDTTGTKDIRKRGTVALAANDIISGAFFFVQYDQPNNRWQLVSDALTPFTGYTAVTTLEPLDQLVLTRASDGATVNLAAGEFINLIRAQI